MVRAQNSSSVLRKEKYNLKKILYKYICEVGKVNMYKINPRIIKIAICEAHKNVYKVKSTRA